MDGDYRGRSRAGGTQRTYLLNLMGRCRADLAQVGVGSGTLTSRPPSWVNRFRPWTVLGAGTNPPANSASPCRNSGDWLTSADGAKPKIVASSSRSRCELIRISARLSH